VAGQTQANLPLPLRAVAPPIPGRVRPGPEAEPAVAVEASPAPVPPGENVEETEVGDLFASSAGPADDLPPPVYQPEPPAFEPSIEEEEDLAAAFVAPSKPAPGTPSPEALARLQNAVAKQPNVAATTPRPMAEHPPQPTPAEEKPRFGINSLIGRMTGGAEGGDPQAVRKQPPVQSMSRDTEQDANEERIEIPAFLRRQAN